MKSIQVGKEELKLSLLSADMILHVENQKESNFLKPLELIEEFSKVARYENNTQKKSIGGGT